MIHRGCMIVVFTAATELLLELDVDEIAESLLAALRANATEKANGISLFQSFIQSVNAVSISFLHYVLLLQELSFLILHSGRTQARKAS